MANHWSAAPPRHQSTAVLFCGGDALPLAWARPQPAGALDSVGGGIAVEFNGECEIVRFDYEDGSLEQLAMAPYPLSVLVMGEVAAHWIATGLLLALVSPLFATMLGLSSAALPTLVASLLLGTLSLTLIGAVGSALTVSIRRGGLLLSLLIIPLNVPVLIFGTTAVSEAVINGNTVSWLALLGGLALGSLALLPLAIGAALRVSLDN